MIRGTLLAVAIATAAQPPSATPGILQTTILDNATITTTRVRVEADAAETVHTHQASLLLVLMNDADVERTVSGQTKRSHEMAGSVWFVRKDAPHASKNVGKAAVEAIAIAIKPTRPAATEAPASVAPPGITRTTMLDNDEVRVVRVRFGPDGREPVHMHPNDLLTIQLTSGRVEIAVGSDKSTASHGPGFVQFVPRNVAHAYASADTKPFELISVAIK